MAGFLLGGLALLAANVVAIMGVRGMHTAIVERTQFRSRIDADRQLHIAVLQAERSWHHFMAEPGATTLAVTRSAVAEVIDRRGSLQSLLESVPLTQPHVAVVFPVITVRMAEMLFSADLRPALSREEAERFVSQVDREYVSADISAGLDALAYVLVGQWEDADRRVTNAGTVLTAATAGSAAIGAALLVGSGIFAVVDTRRRAQAHEAAVQREAYNRRLIEASFDALVAVDPAGMITDVNQAMCRVLGTPREELVGSPFAVHFSDPAGAAAGVRLAFERGSVADYDLVPKQADLLVSFNAAIFQDPATGEAQGIIAAARDVTESRQLQRRLADQQAYTRELIESSLDALATIDRSGIITDVNLRMETLTGLSRAELIGSPFADRFTDAHAAQEGVDRVFQAGAVTDYLLTVRGLGGREVPVSYNASIYHDAEGRAQGVFAAARDVTVRERALQQANSSLESFAYSVSHDLRAPLRAMAGFARALLEDYGSRLDATGHDYAERVWLASERMSSLIDDLLRLSYLARAELRMERVDMTAMAEGVAEELRRTEPDRRVAFVIEKGLRAWADPRLIRTVLENLLGNAWKFTRPREQATIEFGRLPADPGWTGFFVRDDGVGFDAAYRDRLFRPFERLHSSAEFPGTGIGLASVSRVVERHGGRAWADAGQPVGAMFCFTIREEEPA